MKLEWKIAGCASITRVEDLTAVVLYNDNTVEHRWQVLLKDGRTLQCGTVRSSDFADAEIEVKAIFEENDKPQWKQCEAWLWSTTWRGVGAYCRESSSGMWDGFSSAKQNRWTPVMEGTAETCMSAVEAAIRERTGGEE